MEATTLWEQVKAWFGLDAPRAPQTVAMVLQALLVGLATVLVARWAGDRVHAAARSGNATADIASLASRAAALAITVIGIGLLLSILGLNSTAIAAILGAATFGISLALQDVAKAFVNGVYVLVERPFRIGDRIRVDDVEGRVEDIGVHLTRLRTDAGERILLPNTVIFASNIERATVGNYDRRKYTLTGIERPVLDLESAVTQALKGTPHLSHRLPFIEVIGTGPNGTTAHVTVEHDRGHRIDDQVMSRLHGEFPEATVTTRTADDANP